MDKGRVLDVKELKEDLKKTTDPLKRKLIEKAGNKIAAEQHDGWVRDARHKMIDEKLQGRQGNVRDIQDTMITKQRSNSVTYGFSDVKYWPFKNDA